MFRRHPLPLPSIIDDLEYEPEFLCPSDDSCIMKNCDPNCCMRDTNAVRCISTLDVKKVIDKFPVCAEGVGNCVICQCPLIEEDSNLNGYFLVTSALSCGHVFHSTCLMGQIKIKLLKEIGMAARVGRKMEKCKVTLDCAICQQKSCISHGYFVPPNFLLPLDLKLKTQHLNKLLEKTAEKAERPKKRRRKSKNKN